MKLQEKLSDSKFDRTLVTIFGDEYLFDTSDLDLFIETCIMRLQND